MDHQQQQPTYSVPHVRELGSLTKATENLRKSGSCSDAFSKAGQSKGVKSL